MRGQNANRNWDEIIFPILPLLFWLRHNSTSGTTICNGGTTGRIMAQSAAQDK